MSLLSTVVAVSVKGLLLCWCDGIDLYQLQPVLVVLLVPVSVLMATHIGCCLLLITLEGLTLFFTLFIQAIVDPDSHYHYGV